MIKQDLPLACGSGSWVRGYGTVGEEEVGEEEGVSLASPLKKKSCFSQDLCVHLKPSMALCTYD